MYKSTVVRSNRDLTAREKIAYKDGSQAVSLFDVVPTEGDILLDIDTLVLLHVENDNSENKEYDILLIQTKDGEIYSTSSDSFINSVWDIYDELADMGDDGDVTLRAYKCKSKNNNGYFLSCSLKA